MPIYVYEDENGEQFELIRPVKDRETMVCNPDTGAMAVRLVPTAPYVRPESMVGVDPLTGGKVIYNDSKDDWWAGSGVRPNENYERSTHRGGHKRIQVDQGAKYNVAASH